MEVGEGPSLESCLKPFTLPHVLTIIGEVVKLPRSAKRKWAVLFKTLRKFPAATQESIKQIALATVGTKRKGAAVPSVPNKRARLEVEPDIDVDQLLLDGPFFQPPTKEVQEGAIINMIERTSNEALSKASCMVCARKLFLSSLIETKPENIPNPKRLVPAKAHRAHTLVESMLLHDDAIDEDITYLCKQCKTQLLLDECPPLALANGMWVGRTPFQLKVLTLPERLLVALYFPAAYVIKLYPKAKGATFWSKEMMNSGLKGNVSTYRLNTAHIAGLMAGNTMPPSPQILAATIGVTFVGAGNAPLRVLPDFLRVRRQRVFEALVWLKENNNLYANIDISLDQLKLLPVNDVPMEILQNTRVSNDVSAVEREQGGYVPLDAEDEQTIVQDMFVDEPDAARTSELLEEGNSEQCEPAIFPLQAHGVVDVHGDSVPDDEILAHALTNVATLSSQKEFLVRKGSDFVNEYARVDDRGQRIDGGPENANHMLGAFPTLFPYGLGGLEVDREANVSYEAHTRWALEYSDGRFRRDLYFIFQAFGVIQKRQVCRSACLQIKRSAFIANKVAFLKLKPDDFVKASAEETRKVAFSNPVIRTLRKQLTSIRARVAATDESRISIRAQVWGMNLYFNPPSIWATVNLPDTSDPMAQVLAGNEIDMDRFIATVGPDRSGRAIAIAGDPFAAAEFFHLTIRAILEDVFGIVVNHKSAPSREPGVVGIVNGYIGTVEAQARGSLHLHILFWLKGSPSAGAMKAALETQAFRSKVTAFLKQTIRADIKGTTADTVLPLKKESAVAYSRPVDPREANYEQRRDEAEATIARAVQVHTCTVAACLRTKNGCLVCKRRAPWPLSEEDWVHPSGEWGPRRVFGRMNAWNPTLLQVTRSNQDMKIITNGQDTKDITFYITLYIAKKQNQASNASALLAKSLAFQRNKSLEESNARDLNKRMIQQCANTLSREQELSGPEVVSYLMGWGDRYISHKFVQIYWDTVTAALKKTFPGLERTNVLRRTADVLNQPIPEQAREEPYDPPVRLRVEEGVFVLKDQLKEYTDRGTLLDSMSYFEYHVNTYDGNPLRSARRDGVDADNEDGVEDEDATEEPELRQPGRPASKRVPYLSAAKRKGCRVVRGEGMETLPHFIGSWFPRPDNQEYYCANMLALLKPWRNLTELRAEGGTFRSMFDSFMATATIRQQRVVQNVNYFHECSDSARQKRDVPLQELAGTVDLHDQVRAEIEAEERNAAEVPMTEIDVALARAEQYDAREYMYGNRAMEVAYGMGIFEREDGEALGGGHCDRASFQDMITYADWGAKLTSMTRSEAVSVSNIVTAAPDAHVVPGAPAVYGPEVAGVPPPLNAGVRSPEQQATLDMLNIEQRRAHDIIEQHLRRTIAGTTQEPLLMIVRGEGGTGKTVLLNAIADTFAFLEVPEWLAKTATTGVAASLVAGVTVHSWAGISVNAEDSPNWVHKAGAGNIERRKKNILPAKYLNIDECSMLTKRLLAQLAQVISHVRSNNGEGNSIAPFAGTNVILFGDFHQFPPVGDPSNALYCPRNTRTQNAIGHTLYHQFTTVVTLTEQIRIVDLVWIDLLRRLRVGGCTEGDMAILRTLLVTHPSCAPVDTHVHPWDSASLVTPRHAARVRWNTAALIKHCKRTGNRMYVSQAEDTAGRGEEALDLMQRVTVAGMPVKKTAKLADRVELAVGMRAMVLLNIATEADLANGTRGEVVDIKLDPRELEDFEYDTETGATMLRYPPVLVLFRPDDSSYPSFEGLPQGTLPIVPTKFGFTIESGNKKTHIHRRQLAMTPAYAFTDYKSQGQTIKHVYIDLQKPPTGTLTPFSAYVALSRSKGRDSIRLLRGFDEALFTTHPSPDLEEEDRRLDELTLQTKTMYP